MVVLFVLSWRLGPVLASERNLASAVSSLRVSHCRISAWVIVQAGTSAPPSGQNVCAGVILTTAMTAALYKRQTKAVERDNAAAQTRMTAVANQAFRCTADSQHCAT